MNKYVLFNRTCEETLGNFPMIFAFSNEQLEEGLNKLGVTKEELYSIGSGGFIRKKDKDSYYALLSSFDSQLNLLIDEDDEFVLQMFEYEMGNHEYCITYDDDEILRACCLDRDKFINSSRLKKLYQEAKENYLSSVE